ncbi:MAG: hypothetical protein MI740_14135 [Halanaerobiales bacterium]|nr:hypothetical protein [Halanaerobiales bacterium]
MEKGIRRDWFFLIFKIKQLVLILFICTIISGTVCGQEIMRLEEVLPGMTGIGKTVFRGFTVESFPIEVIDIMEDQGLNRDLILIKAGGEEIDRIGGIAAGMSGSPIYINDRLVGAIGYGWRFSDHHYGLVTPIEAMLDLIDQQQTVSEYFTPESLELKTPLMVSGLNGRALARLEESLAAYNFKLVQSGGAGRSKERVPEKLEAGSAVAVQLVRGDINISSIGTLTYLDQDNNILAFGHPFLNKGKTDYMLSRAYINEIIPSLEQPFKLGAPTKELIGSIKVDRGAGVAGKLNQSPRIIPLSIQVIDRELIKLNRVNVQLIKEENLLTTLAINIALQSIDATLDRIGRGTAWVNYKITANGLPDLVVEREDVYYSRNDIAATALSDFYQLLNILTTNPFQKINFIDLKLEVEVDQVNNVALVKEAVVLNKTIQPGDQLELEVTIQPYRQEPMLKRVTIDLPADIESGMATIAIDGGFTGKTYQKAPKEKIGEEIEVNQAIVEGYTDFDSILEDFLNLPKSNELIIQVFPSYPVEGIDAEEGEGEQPNGENLEPEQEAGEMGKELETEEEEPEIKKVIETEYVLEGNLVLDINIERNEDNEDNEGLLPLDE